MHIFSPHGFFLWDPTNLQYLLQYEIVDSVPILADRL